MLDFFRRRSAGLKDEVLAGLIVALALVPEAVAFALIAGVSPMTGTGRGGSWRSVSRKTPTTMCRPTGWRD
jgi:hypothetical protein